MYICRKLARMAQVTVQLDLQNTLLAIKLLQSRQQVVSAALGKVDGDGLFAFLQTLNQSVVNAANPDDLKTVLLAIAAPVATGAASKGQWVSTPAPTTTAP